MATAGDAITEAQQVYLNDTNQALYPSSVLLPIAKKAQKDLELELVSNQVTELKEMTSTLSVPIGTPVLNNVLGFPADFSEPIKLLEKPSGASNDQYSDMEQLPWEPDIVAEEAIKYWDFREGEIKLNLATSVRDVKLRYYKSLNTIVDVNTVLTIPLSVGYLSARIGAIAALTIGENPTRASACNEEAGIKLAKIINVMVKRTQGIAVRRRRFKPFGR